MILAGGTLATAACTSGSSSTPGGCCNANGDPCCEYKYCGGALTQECSQEMACEADGGTWDYTGACTHDAGVPDAAPEAGDASADGDAHD